MPLKITFLTTLDCNVGDEFVRQGRWGELHGFGGALKLVDLAL